MRWIPRRKAAETPFVRWARHGISRRLARPAPEPEQRLSLRIRCALLAAYLPLALYATRDISGEASLYWMDQFSPADFATWRDVWAFFRELRTGVPPPLAMLELSSWMLWGTLAPVEIGLYRVSLIAAFAFPFLLPISRGRGGTFASFALSALFLHCAIPIHRWNPQIYDILYPFLLMSGMGLLLAAKHFHGRPVLALVLCAAAGFSFSMMELIRPFALFIAPVLLYWGWSYIRTDGASRIIALFLPVLLFSGGWHAKLLLCHEGQIIWSNHGGHNLARAWITQGLPGLEWPELESEPAPLDSAGRGGVRSLKSEVNQRNSRILQYTIYGYILTHPFRSARHMAGRTLFFAWPHAHESAYDLPDLVVSIYSLAVFGCFGLMWWSVFLLALHAISRRSLRVLRPWENALILATFLTATIIPLTEAGEESRFLLSVLPLIAALPAMRSMETAGKAVSQGADFQSLPQNPQSSVSPPEKTR